MKGIRINVWFCIALPLVSSSFLSPDARVIVSGSNKGTVKLWNAATGKELRSLAGHADSITSVVFSPDGKVIASGSYDRMIKLWDTATGQQLRSLAGHADSVNSIAFSPDGKVIVSGSEDETIKLWRSDSDRPLATLMSLDKNDWVVVTPEGRFDASPGAEKLMHYVVNTPEGQYQIIPLEQLKSRHHEPGLLQKLLKGEPLRSVSRA